MIKHILGIGNALTDMLVSLSSDDVLKQYQLAKGSMSLVDSQMQTDVLSSVAGCPYSLSLGGSAGNTIRAMARLGTEVGFIGKVGNDSTGDFYIQALRSRTLPIGKSSCRDTCCKLFRTCYIFLRSSDL